MCFGGNQEIPWESLMPEWKEAGLKQLAALAGGQIGTGATPYQGPLAAPIDPSMVAAQQMMWGLMGDPKNYITKGHNYNMGGWMDFGDFPGADRSLERPKYNPSYNFDPWNPGRGSGSTDDPRNPRKGDPKRKREVDRYSPY